jgi:hypothetical protein
MLEEDGQRGLEEGEHQKLDGRQSAQQHAHGDEHGDAGEVGLHQPWGKGRWNEVHDK